MVGSVCRCRSPRRSFSRTKAAVSLAASVMPVGAPEATARVPRSAVVGAATT